MAPAIHFFFLAMVVVVHHHGSALGGERDKKNPVGKPFLLLFTSLAEAHRRPCESGTFHLWTL